MIILMFGPPQSGKGTLGRRISRTLGIPYYAAGEEIRRRLRENPGWFQGRYSQEMHDDGMFCPPDLVRDLMFGLLRDAGLNCVLDGYPRNMDQFEMMGELGAKYTVAHLVLPDEVLVRRASNRRVCSECGEIFQIGNPFLLPPEDGVCGQCGGDIVQRGDDEEETVRVRLRKYRDETLPTLQSLRERADHHIDFTPSGTNDVDAEAQELLDMMIEEWND
jgi:adenylate kinase